MSVSSAAGTVIDLSAYIDQEARRINEAVLIVSVEKSHDIMQLFLADPEVRGYLQNEGRGRWLIPSSATGSGPQC